MLEPMYVLTYITDQHQPAGRRGRITSCSASTLDDGSFINVIYQKNLDVLDVPFRIQPDVRIPVGTYKFDEWMLTYNTNPARRFYERFTFQPMEFYGGTQADRDRRGRRPRQQPPVERAAVQPQRRRSCRGATSSSTWRSCASTTRSRRA